MKLKGIFLLMVFVFPVVLNSNAAHVYQALEVEERDSTTEINFEFRLKRKEYTTSYITHPSIEILSDADFVNYSSSGIGTIDEPFVIENYNITTTDTKAITVESTTKYFIIRNCVLSADSIGIYLYNIAFGTGLLENNNCSITNHMGIWGKYAHGVKIVNNTCFDNHRIGILLKECNNVTIIDNMAEKNPGGGIMLDDCLNSEVRDNIVIENSYQAGIRLHYSNGTRVVNNTCINNEVAGIRCFGSDDAIIEHNFIFNDNGRIGIAVTDSLSVSILNNTVRSDRKSLSIYGSPYTQMISNKFYCTGIDISETYHTNYLLYTVEDNTVNDLLLGYFKEPKSVKISEPIYGQIFIVYGSKITIENQNSEPGFIGVTLHNCNSILIKNLKIINTPEASPAWGVWVYDSKDIEVNNIIFRNGYGGIILKNTNNSLIKSNLCENNSAYGIWLTDSNNNELVNNTCKKSAVAGIRFDDSDNCNIKYNYLKENGFSDHCNVGLFIDGKSDYNIIHHNIFIENNFNGTPQAADWGKNNIWFELKTLSGNYYDDWSGIGEYPISGGSNSIDPYPLSEIPIYTGFNYNNLFYLFFLLVPLVAFVIIRPPKFLKNLLGR
ncbi:MAG: NosD domain-containing protein [Candidatus Heimdallarchaeaceae archaeon]